MPTAFHVAKALRTAAACFFGTLKWPEVKKQKCRTVPFNYFNPVSRIARARIGLAVTGGLSCGGVLGGSAQSRFAVRLGAPDLFTAFFLRAFFADRAVFPALAPRVPAMLAS